MRRGQKEQISSPDYGWSISARDARLIGMRVLPPSPLVSGERRMTTEPRSGRLALVVGGGPAPGINGVISSVTIEAVEQGFEVIGFQDGFKWLVQGDSSHYRPLSIDDVKGIHL